MKHKNYIYFEKGEDWEPPPRPLVKPPRSTKIILIKRREPVVEKRKREDPIPIFLKARDDLKDLPIYLIDAHSCLAPIGVPCYRERPDVSFEIPENTYVISFAQANDVFRGSTFIDRLIIKNRESFRKYLYLHDTNDMIEHPQVGDTHFSLFTGVTRATAPSQYPNVAFTFNCSETTGERNASGIYCIDSVDEYQGLKTLNNTKSIIKEDPKRNNFMLKDIIEEVYQATGSRKGIFILTGCMPVYHSSAVTNKINNESVRFAGNLIHIANNYYRTLRPTWTKEELDTMGLIHQIPIDIPTNFPVTAMDPDEIIDMEKEELSDAAMILESMPSLLSDEEDRGAVIKALSLKTTSHTSPVPQP